MVSETEHGRGLGGANEPLFPTVDCPNCYGRPRGECPNCGTTGPETRSEPLFCHTPEEKMAAALQPFGWTCGPAFWRRYYTDPWVFNLANAVERLTDQLRESSDG